MEKGSRFANRFTILERAGAGGTATVYRAFDDDRKAVVALKVFSVVGADPDVVAEFWNREHKCLGLLTHPAIAKLLDAGRDSETSQRFIVLEWIDGVPLERHLDATGKLAWQPFFENIGEQLLAALVFAAENNVSHRDLSTSNILVTATGEIKIIDFGQAKFSDLGVGRTVAGWRTAPYCPPEEDTGRYTYTRDPYSFCAIAVRACAGYELKDHDVLYKAFEEAVFPDEVRDVLTRALSREPKERFPNCIEFDLALRKQTPAQTEAPELVIAIRMAPGILERARAGADDEEDDDATSTEVLLREVNDTISVAPALSEAGVSSTRIEIETQSYRLIADIDSTSSDHLVVVSQVPKRFKLDSLYQPDRWMPRVRFVSTLPRRREQRLEAQQSIRLMFQGLEEFQANAAQRRRPTGAAVTEWERLLEALRYIARHEVPPLKYLKLESEGSWLTASVENPEDAEEAQIRTISVDGRWVFRGEIDSVRGDQCILVSTRPRIDLDAIPSEGILEIDWQQTKVALDRQARAVERFKNGELPNPELGRLLTGEERGPVDPTFANVKTFFDPTLDAPKKSIVARCVAGVDLLVTHGPPGTGKTKLIVELVRQCISASPDARILLVSQTHAALDNALERILKADPDVSCVRIGSGSKETDPRVEKCTVEQRGRSLQSQVSEGSQRFLEARAKALGVNRAEVEVGLRALDVCGLRERIAALSARKAELEEEFERVRAAGSDQVSTERTTRQLRLEAIGDNLDRIDAQVQLSGSELAVAEEKLTALGPDAREMALQTSDELRQWADVLIEGEKHRALSELMKVAEDWRLRFGQSDDFKAAIISSSSIVAGTCVGFCREEAASRATFDLCIVDEAGKATTTELLVPLTQSRRAVVVGDHHQLPAVIDHAINRPELMERYAITPQQIEVQLFEELTQKLAGGCRAGLTVQYRMRGAIGSLVSKCFYDGFLETDSSLAERCVPNLSLAGLSAAVTWVDPYVGHGSDRFEQRVGTSFASFREVQCIHALLRKIAFVFEHSLRTTPWPSVAVITGYASQARQIRSEIRRDSQLDKLKVECATVHAFQGREVDVCIYSVARRNREHQIGMLRDWRHLNVALSRARDYLVIVGGLAFCGGAAEPNPFREIVEFVEQSPDCAVTEWPDD